MQQIEREARIFARIRCVHPDRAFIRSNHLRAEHRRLAEHRDSPLPVIHDSSLEKVRRRDPGRPLRELEGDLRKQQLISIAQDQHRFRTETRIETKGLPGVRRHRVNPFARFPAIGDRA